MSWSGERSLSFAEVLKPWLEQVLPGTDVWLSSEDIDKGTIWFTEIIEQLGGCHCGVLCITRDNYLAPWIHFEAGGMVKGLGKGRIATILLDLDYPELKPPLNQFNALRLNRQGAWHLVKSFNRISDRPIKDYVLERTFEKFWPDLDNDYRTLFPESHRATSGLAEPVHMAPEPTRTVFAPLVAQPSAPRKKRRPAADSESAQADLFGAGK